MASCVIRTCSSVDLPEPVLPATSTCCEVPWPSSRYCLPCAPKRPTGTRMPVALSLDHQASCAGMIHSNGTSTLLARTASSPTCRNISVQRSGGGDFSSVSGNMPKSSSSQTKRPLPSPPGRGGRGGGGEGAILDEGLWPPSGAPFTPDPSPPSTGARGAQ